MKIVSARLALLLLFGSVAACNGAIPDMGADFGGVPWEYKEEAIKGIRWQLRDSMTARYGVGEPVKVWVNRGPLKGGGVEFTGYVVPVWVNGKNAYGGYTGFKKWYCLLKQGVEAKCYDRDWEADQFIHRERQL